MAVTYFFLFCRLSRNNKMLSILSELLLKKVKPVGFRHIYRNVDCSCFHKT